MNELNPYGALRVLIADDSEYMQLLLKVMLRGLGVGSVESVDGAEQALRYLRSDMPDVLVTDWKMPGMSGIDLVARVRNGKQSLNPYLSIIMVTGHAGTQEIARARDAGVTEFLAKPVSAAALASRLAEVVERPRSFVRSPTFFGPDRRRRVSEFGHPDRRTRPAYYTTPEQIRLFVDELRSRMAEGPVERIEDLYEERQDTGLVRGR